MRKVFLAAVAADEAGAVGADGQLGDKDAHLLPFGKELLTEVYDIGKPAADCYYSYK